ncbi:MAG TPA: hypothetical protein VKK79_15350 [Candidatus Lokiarchaeia archaeon]|nr:hypothetical protein [Candidatus Lokiarchaeia archaeon]
MAESPAVGYCIRCGTPMTFNLENPLCNLCGGTCSAINRSSAIEETAYFCHGCGQSGLMSLEKPLCEQCINSQK